MSDKRVLSGRYELVELVGSGGMADVYKAKDLLLSRQVAVKILHESFRGDAEFIGKFHLEAKSAAGLTHPNIVGIYDVGADGADHYIVMEYVEGDTLKNRIKNGKMSIDAALNTAREIAEALAHAHERHIVHCDIKPHNILMTADNHAKVADFGIARAVTESTVTYSGNVIGSVHYFSPEQAKGSFITPKSDVYSLGVVLYEMLTGTLPFTGETPVAIAMKHLQETPLSVRQHNPDIPPLIDAIVMKALEKDPADRPTAAEFARDLAGAQSMLAGSGNDDPFATRIISAVDDTRSEKAKRPKDGKSFFESKLFMLGLGIVLIIGFAAGAFISFGNFFGTTSEIAVPDVVGKQMTLARQILEDDHLRVNVAETYDAAVPAGQVVSQSPDGGTKVKSERLVTIYVSKGGENIEMPDLMGLVRADAEAKLKRMGFVLGSVYDKFSDKEAGTVVGQDPRAGAKIAKGDRVDITVSKGEQEKKKKKVNVPNLRGGTLDAAKSSILDRGLAVGNITKEASRQAAGTIVSQSPSAGSEVEEGTNVNLVVAEAAKENSAKESQPKTSSADATEAPTFGGAAKSR